MEWRDDDEYRIHISSFTQSILAGVQRLWELKPTIKDEDWANMMHYLEKADDAVWSTLEFLENDRKVEL